MHTGNKYSAFEIFLWTLKPTAIIVLICSIPTTLYHFDITFEYIPWQPIALLGTALSFIVGFKNNASYGRIWEARQIYGAIVNDSRSFGYTVRDALGLKHSGAVQRLFYRHFAWLTAMRFQLREPRAWENMNRSNNRRYRNSHYSVPEWGSKLEVELENT
ncbi:MAG: bestrophin family ion channel [Bacteroidia bacterium]